MCEDAATKKQHAFRRTSRSVLAALCLGGLLAACEPMPEGASLYYASGEIGHTYTLQSLRRVYACPHAVSESIDKCIARGTGIFTVDNAAKQAGDQRTVVHLVFDDGRSGWMGYDDFLRQRFTVPAKTSVVLGLGMTADEIRSSWGEPAAIAPHAFAKSMGQEWSYPDLGNLYFEDGKLVEIALSRALPFVR